MINKLVKNLSLYIALIIFGILVCISAYSTCFISMEDYVFAFYNNDSIIINLLVAVVIIFIIVFIRKTHYYSKLSNFINEYYIIIKYILLLTIMFECLYFVFSAKLTSVADQYWIQNAVCEFKNGNYSSIMPGGYLFLYRNQLGFFYFSYLLSYIFGSNNYFAFQIINCLCVVYSYKLISDIDLLNNSKISSLIILFFGMIFIPMILFTTFVYGNIIGLMISIASIKYSILFSKTKKLRHLMLSILFTALPILFKSNYAINAIAIALFYIMTNTSDKKDYKYIFIFIISTCLLTTLLLQLPQSFIKKKTGVEVKNGIPKTAWVAMGLQDTEGFTGPGWYNQYSYKIFVNNNYDAETTSKEAINNIIERLEYFGNNKTYAAKFFLKKISSMWNEPSFESFGINKQMDFYNQDNNKNFAKYYDNYYYIKANIYLNIIQFITYFGCLLYTIILIANKQIETNDLLYIVIFIGGFIFHLFWEIKSRYAITYFILLIPFAIQGFKNLSNTTSKINKNKIFDYILPFSIIITVIFVFILLNNYNISTCLKNDSSKYQDYINSYYSYK